MTERPGTERPATDPPDTDDKHAPRRKRRSMPERKPVNPIHEMLH